MSSSQRGGAVYVRTALNPCARIAAKSRSAACASYGVPSLPAAKGP